MEPALRRRLKATHGRRGRTTSATVSALRAAELADLPDAVEGLPSLPGPVILLLVPLCAVAAARILLWDYKVSLSGSK